MKSSELLQEIAGAERDLGPNHRQLENIICDLLLTLLRHEADKEAQREGPALTGGSGTAP